MAAQSGVIVRVGSDRVCVGEDRVVIEAAELMDWPLREFCRVPIFFEGRKYFLHRLGQAEKPYAKRYELCPWPANLHEESPRTVCYDTAYVANRDQLARQQRRFDRLHLLLLPLYPFLGLCWSGLKNGLLNRIGFEPRSITAASVALAFNLLILEGIFVGWLRGGLLLVLLGNARLQAADLALMALLAGDTVARYSQLLKTDVQRHWGFCEWMIPARRRDADLT